MVSIQPMGTSHACSTSNDSCNVEPSNTTSMGDARHSTTSTTPDSAMPRRSRNSPSSMGCSSFSCTGTKHSRRLGRTFDSWCAVFSSKHSRVGGTCYSSSGHVGSTCYSSSGHVGSTCYSSVGPSAAQSSVLSIAWRASGISTIGPLSGVTSRHCSWGGWGGWSGR